VKRNVAHGQHLEAVDDMARLVRRVVPSHCTEKAAAAAVDTLRIDDDRTENTVAGTLPLHLTDCRSEGVADSLAHILGKKGDTESILRNDRAVPVVQLA
jgi:hypothetical protein